MNNTLVWLVITISSASLSLIHYKSIDYKNSFKEASEENKKYLKILDIYKFFVNYFIASVILYYFLRMRWPIKLADVSLVDYVLGIVFLIGIFGWLSYFVKNITEAINVIFERLLKK